MRQQGPDQEPFRQCLEGLRNNAVSVQHWQLLCSRVQSEVAPAVVAEFSDALRLYGKKADVNEYNHVKMRDLGKSVRLLKAEHAGGPEAEKASWDQGGNLHATLPVCIGARVMLTENLWTEKGLVNGAPGTVRALHWTNRQDFAKAVPTVLIQFDNYAGPTLSIEGHDCVPIVPSQRDFIVSGITCSRLQVPITIAWAITIHKAQGITAPRIVTNLTDKEHVVGLHYVAVSRVKEIKHIMFETPFDYAKFRAHKPTQTEVMRLGDAAVRRVQHVSDSVPE